MDSRVEVPLDEVMRVFKLLEALNAFMHQPTAHADPRQMERFVELQYPEVRQLYYHVVWSWLPEHVRARIEAE